MDLETQNHLLSIVKQNYSDIAAHYDETRKKKFGNTWAALIDLVKDVKDGQSVLDAGCGNGRLLDLFQDKQIDYLGIDASDELISLAKKNYPNQKFLVADLTCLSSLGDQKFDYIFSIAVFHHFPGQSLQLQVLQDLKLHLNHNGKLIITAWNWNQSKFRNLLFKLTIKKIFGLNKMDFGDMLFDWKNQQGQIVSQRYYHAFTAYGLKKLAKSAGFKDIEIIKNRYNIYLIASN